MTGKEFMAREAVLYAAGHRYATTGIRWPADVREAMVSAALSDDENKISAMHSVAEQYEMTLQKVI